MQELNNSSNLGAYFAIDQVLEKILLAREQYNDFSVGDVIRVLQQEKSDYAIKIIQQ